MSKSTSTAAPRRVRSRSGSGDAGIRPGSIADRTRNQLLDAASTLIGEIGHVPSIGEVARAAGVSRATAYRYFSSRSRLIAAVVDSSLGPVRRFESTLQDVDSRVVELFGTTFVRFREFEPQMRSALQLSLEHAALEAAGRLDEDRYRRGYRIDILRRTFAPLRQSMPARSVDRLCKAMSLLFGIEPYVVLKDIWDCDNEEVCRIALWMARALLRQAQMEAAALSASAR
jgi:AcrR family transcriptional regulator